MRKLSPQEQQFLAIIERVGGTHCFGRDDPISAEAMRMLRRLERAGIISVEQTDDGPRVTISDGGAHG